MSEIDRPSQAIDYNETALKKAWLQLRQQEEKWNNEYKRQKRELDEEKRKVDVSQARKKLEMAQKEQDLDKREQELDHKQEEIAKEFAETRNKAIEMFNEKFTECQARYYQRYQELENQFSDNFQQFTQGREAQLQNLEKQYLDKNQSFQEAHARLVNEFQQQAQEQAVKAAAQQAEALLRLQQDFQQQAQSYQQQFAKNLQELEEGHQEQLQDSQRHYTDYYLDFQQNLSQQQEKLAKRFAEDAAKMEAAYAARQSELQQLLQARLEAVQQTLEQRSEQSLQDEVARRQQSWQEHQQHLQENFAQHEAEHQRLIEELRQRQSELTAKELEVEEQRHRNEEETGTITMNQRLLEVKERELENREAAIEDVLDDRMEARIASWEAEKSRLEEELERLRAGQEEAESKAAMYGDLDRYLAGRPALEVVNEIRQEKQAANKAYQSYQQGNDQRVADSERHRQEAERQTQEWQDKYQELTSQYEQQKQAFLQSQKAVIDAETLQQQVAGLTKQLDATQKEKNYYYEHLKRISAEFDNGQEREARVAILEDPQIKPEKPQGRLPLADYRGAEQEIKWLEQIDRSCKDFGMTFHPRILYAFHTALKTAEWSPLTVLAGVSGTGKSELPRLYAAFGGMNFLGVSVQPNWDSQESMLGFFNSIDNKFDAQPVLRFLVQSQIARTDNTPYGLEDAMNLILLDEMNLAYVELYFAEFLSKLESRRGLDDRSVPSLDVKLGAGQKPYDLRLGRNVLWAGTMNQDETTKALSDKVLDRSFVINFPRPHQLISRQKLPKLQEVQEVLTYKIWQSWCHKTPVFSDEAIRPYREKIERINAAMGRVGRAIGHRVWQSMEYYMSNYPLADSEDPQLRQDAMNKAFEDQLVQKVMPKLRGIETRGLGDKCLNEIEHIIAEDESTSGLRDDFQMGKELGYGQFIWNSAEYLQKDLPAAAPAESEEKQPIESTAPEAGND